MLMGQRVTRAVIVIAARRRIVVMVSDAVLMGVVMHRSAAHLQRTGKRIGRVIVMQCVLHAVDKDYGDLIHHDETQHHAKHDEHVEVRTAPQPDQ